MFRTEIPLIPHSQPLPPSARVLTVGSCFAETMGRRLADYKVDALVNPFGTVFNPLAACQLLRAAAGEEADWQQHLVEARGRWQSYDLHAAIGAESPVALLQRIQELVGRTGEFLRTADAVVLTLGTAWVYRLNETGELVNNCHKVPADKFAKELLTPDEIVNAVAETHAYLRRARPNLRFILTVSPVRHLKDTLVLNSVSKSALRVACHYLSELLPDVAYFPAYELLLDDLRDYRFYAEDMLHPSKVAEDYLWERFTRTYFNAEFGRFKQEWTALRQALAHRPLYAAAPEHRQFLEGVLARLQQLGAQTDVQAEVADVQQRLATLPVPVVAAPLPEPDDDEERIDIGDEAAPVVEALLAEAAVADSAAPDEETVAEAPLEEEIALLAEDDMARPAPKKKRRSRGGAKRTARKRAALAVQATEETAPATAEASDAAPQDAAPEAMALADAPAPAAPLPAAAPVDEPATPAEPTEAAEVPPSTLDKARRGRSAGQILADQKKRRGGRKPGATTTPAATTAAPVAAAPVPAEAPVVTEAISRENAAEPATTPAAAPTLPVMPTPEPAPALVSDVAPTPAEPTTEPAGSAEPVAEPAGSAEPVAEPAGDAPAPAAAKPKKARPARKKSAAKVAVDQKAAVEAPANPDAETPAAEEPKAPKPRPARKKPAPKKPAAAAETPAAPEAMAAVKAPPKRRPARKKPAPTDETPSAS